MHVSVYESEICLKYDLVSEFIVDLTFPKTYAMISFFAKWNVFKCSKKCFYDKKIIDLLIKLIKH